ncbi:MAG: hypothetical protein MUC68_01215 [Burkholderiaceae bacterium]|nr:hypothetical protein [Burkholderiaceae bacterium]
MRNALAIAAVALGTAAALPASAQGVSVRVDTPEIGIRFGTPRPPVYVAVPAPIYAPPPVFVTPRPPVAYYPAPIYAPPPRVVMLPPPPVYVPYAHGRAYRYVDPYGRVVYVKTPRHKHWRHHRDDD